MSATVGHGAVRPGRRRAARLAAGAAPGPRRAAGAVAGAVSRPACCATRQAPSLACGQIAREDRPGRPVRRLHRADGARPRAGAARCAPRCCGRPRAQGARVGLPAGRSRQPRRTRGLRRLGFADGYGYHYRTPPAPPAERPARSYRPRPSSTPRCRFIALHRGAAGALAEVVQPRHQHRLAVVGEHEDVDAVGVVAAPARRRSRLVPASPGRAAASRGRSARLRSAARRRAAAARARRCPAPAAPKCSGTLTARPL